MKNFSNIQFIRQSLIYLLFIFIVISQGLSQVEITVRQKTISCNGLNDGEIIITIKGGVPEYIVKLYDRTPATKQKVLAEIHTCDTILVLKKLSAKLYYVVFEDSLKSRIQETITIEQPKQLVAETITVERVVSGKDVKDAILKANVTGGTPPYTFKWSSNTGDQITQLANNAGYGTYQCTIDDANGCGPISPTFFYYPEQETKK